MHNARLVENMPTAPSQLGGLSNDLSNKSTGIDQAYSDFQKLVQSEIQLRESKDKSQDAPSA